MIGAPCCIAPWLRRTVAAACARRWPAECGGVPSLFRERRREGVVDGVEYGENEATEEAEELAGGEGGMGPAGPDLPLSHRY